MASATPRVDIHTHIYPPSYVQRLLKRTTVPYVRDFDDNPQNLRLIILPNEDDVSTPSTSRGRPLGPDYHDISRKIAFMNAHDIDISILSLANPWLDFLSPSEAIPAALETNDAFQSLCAYYPNRLYAFGVLPLSSTATAVTDEIHRLKTLKLIRGVIMGTRGMGAGFDDPAMEPVWRALEETQTIAFIHPHYGLPASVYGARASDYGHVLPLALGFPLETTIAIARMYLAGVFDTFPTLKLLLAHSGGTLPYLIGRIDECVKLDAHFNEDGSAAKRRSLADVMQTNIYLDAVLYHSDNLRAAAAAVGRREGEAGHEKLLFGTDHPFFPPLKRSGKDSEQWESTTVHVQSISTAFNQATSEVYDNAEASAKVFGGNAVRLFGLNNAQRTSESLI